MTGTEPCEQNITPNYNFANILSIISSLYIAEECQLTFTVVVNIILNYDTQLKVEKISDLLHSHG